MRLLLIGGNGFIGPYVTDELLRQGHRVAIYHRGRSGAVPGAVTEIIGDRNRLDEHGDAFRSFAPDVVIDFILSSGRQAQRFMEVFRGITGRMLALSSADVYRACGVLHRSEPGPLQELPLTEDSELRMRLNHYPAETLHMLKRTFGWLDDEYDKIPVERTVMSDPDLPGTILRLPMIYGPGDPLHRFFPTLKKINDRRPAILLEETVAHWRGPRGYVENVASAIALAATDPRAQGRIFNVAEPDAPEEIEWTSMIGRATGWHGSVIAVRNDQAPAHLRLPGNYQQHWVTSSARIRDELGFQEQYERGEAFQRTIDWEQAHTPREIDPKQFDYEAEDAILACL